MWASILAALVPASVDLLKSAGGAVARKMWGLSVDDEIKINDAAVKRLQALASLDNPYGVPSQWVVDLRASFRYIAAVVIILAGVALMVMGGFVYLDPQAVSGTAGDAIANLTDTERQELAKLILFTGVDTAGTPFSFIFGERMWAQLRGVPK